MFTIIISEKGGAERRETFERNEINVGRVQGNDLMLPKGNVSKHHARLLYRDGRFIVTDLKSTNGTYVNGRKISQATIVREGDKIYIGDFVLRLETGVQAPAGAADGVPGEGSGRMPAAQRLSPVMRETSGSSPSVAVLDAPTGIPPALAPAGSSTSAPPASPQDRPAEQQGVSHFPLERDPDSESGPDLQNSIIPRVPAPPRLPSSDGRPRVTTAILGAEPARGVLSSPVGDAFAAGRSLPRETAQQAARQAALVTLVDRVTDGLDLSSLDSSPTVDDAFTQAIDRVVREQSKTMRDERELPDGVEVDAFARDALRELVGLGPIGPLLEDDDVHEIQVPRAERVLAVRNGRASIVDVAFTSERALGRIVARLAQGAGLPLQTGESIVDRRLGRGAHMTAVGPPTAAAWTLSIRKATRVEATLDEQQRSGAMSRAMATFLDVCVAARANVLVVGSGAGVVSSVVASIAAAASAGERIAVVNTGDELVVAHAYVTSFARSDGRGDALVRAAASLRPDRLVLMAVAGEAAGATIEVIGEGTDGVVAGLFAPSLRSALARFTAQVALARPGVSVDSAREAVAASFDVVVHASRGPDGRPRLARIAELAGADATGVLVRDIFVASGDATGEAGFIATGTVPKLAQEFASRGFKLDPALFKRR